MIAGELSGSYIYIHTKLGESLDRIVLGYIGAYLTKPLHHLGEINAEAFENARNEYHRQQQDTFFRSHTITGVTEHVVKSGESVWILSLRQYDVPVWLFRQYNPELDLHNVRRGTRLSFPVLAQNTSG